MVGSRPRRGIESHRGIRLERHLAHSVPNRQSPKLVAEVGMERLKIFFLYRNMDIKSVLLII